MGRLATGIAVSVINADNLPPSKKLPRVSFVDALMPGEIEVIKQKLIWGREIIEVCETPIIVII